MNEPHSPPPAMPKSVDFANEIGTSFVIEGTVPEVALRLDRVVPLPASPRAGGGFTLEFVADPGIDIPQGSYPLSAQGTHHDIFLVPIAREDGRLRLEAVFN